MQAVETKNEQEAPGEKTEEKADDVLILGRTESLEGDYSNRRFDFWKSGLEIFAERPVLGVTYRGFLPFAEKYLPDTYLVTNDFNRITTLDNDVINLMVSNGALGLLCFLLFVFPALFRLFRWIRLQKKSGAALPPAFPLLLAFCAGAAASSLFSSGVFYMHCQYSFLFWLALGILMRFSVEPITKAPGGNAPAHAEKEAAADAG